MQKLILLILLAACSSSEDKNAGPARCLDSGTIDTTGQVDLAPVIDGRIGAGPDTSPNRLPEVLANDCLPLDTGSPDAGEDRKADLALAQDVPAVDTGKTTDQAAAIGEVSRGIDAEEAGPVDTGGPCGPRQILVNGTCQPCGTTGLKCCLTGDKCSAVNVCVNEACFRCGDIGGTCCEGNTCTAGTCKTGVCQ